MRDVSEISLFRQDAKRIFVLLKGHKNPMTAKDISTQLEIPYPSVMRHLTYLMDNGFVQRLNPPTRGYLYAPVGRTFEDLTAQIAKDKTTRKPRAKKQKGGVSLSPQIWWPYADRYMTIPEILIFEKDAEETEGKDYVRGPMAKLALNALNAVTKDGTDESYKTMSEALTKQSRIILGHHRMYEDLIAAYTKAENWDTLKRMAFEENTAVTQEQINELVLKKSLLWHEKQIKNMTETNYTIRTWILGLFRASWNTPLSVEEIQRVFPPMQKERIEYVLSSEMNGDFNLFKEVRQGRVSKWRCAFPDYETEMSNKVAEQIHEKRILEHMFNIISRGPDA